MRFRPLHRRLDRCIAIAERIGCEFEVAEIQAAPRACFGAAIDLADYVGVWQPRVGENELRILIKPPAGLVVNLAVAKSRRATRQQEDGAAFAQLHVGVGPRAQEKQFRDTAVRNEALLAVEYPLIALTLRLELESRTRIVLGLQAVVRPRIRLRACAADQKGIVFNEGLQETLLLVPGARQSDAVAELPALAEGLGYRTVRSRKFAHHQCLGHVIDAMAPP